MDGRITSTPGDAPVSGATLETVFGVTGTTDAAGRFSMNVGGTSPLSVTIKAPGMLQRNTWIGGGQHRPGVVIDVIPTSAPFSLTFYRQFARNAYDAPGATYRAIRRWEQSPHFYIKTTDQDGAPVEAARIDVVVSTIQKFVPEATAGRFGAGTIELGPGNREPRLGWIRVHFRSDEAFTPCGTGAVGGNPGEVILSLRCKGDPLGAPSGTGPSAFVVAHEVGHAMGFWHVEEGLMGRGGSGLQPGASPPRMRYELTDIERHHAAILYSRPNGNTDPDVDPGTYRFLEAPGPAPVVSCYFERSGSS